MDRKRKTGGVSFGSPKMKVSRTVLIVSSFIAGKSEDEINRVLSVHGFCPLYPKRYSDVIWIYILKNHLNYLMAANLLRTYKSKIVFAEKTKRFNEDAILNTTTKTEKESPK